MVDRCRFCDGEPASEFEVREMMFGFRDAFAYARCERCSSLWLRDVPEDLSRYYGHGYYSMAADPKGAEPSTAAALWARTLLWLQAVSARRAGKPGFPVYLRWFPDTVTLQSRIADIGSGEAGLASRLSRHGFANVWAFDPFIDADRDSGNAHYRKRMLSDVDGQFDVILFSHSLEHVPDPVQALRTAAAHLREDGEIIVRIPVAGSYAHRQYGANWIGLDAPRHLSIPSTAGMAFAAATARLWISQIFYDSLPIQFWVSEGYQRGISLRDQDTPDPVALERLARQARELNERRDGDMAGFVLTKELSRARRPAYRHHS
jgi:SAM-dependent methyltransferase